MFGFMSRRDPATGAVSVTRMIDLIRACGLLVVIVTVTLASPRPGFDSAHGLAITITLGLSVVAWVAWMLSGSTGDRHWLSVGSLVAMAGIGGTLAGLSPNSPAVAVGCAATFSAGVRLRTEGSLAILAETIAAFLITGLATGAPAGALLGYTFAYAGLWSVALTRREYLVRAEQAEHMLAETQRAREAETHAAALAERARIARDIHDVLAHSLAAVSVNLEAAEALLGTLPTGRPELGKAIECIGRASVFTKEGLADARRAILALRDDAVPLADQLAELVKEYGTDGDVPVDLVITDSPRPVPAEAGLAVYRTAQEALTNARKHAPGQPVRLSLDYAPAELTMQVVNPLPTLDIERPLAASGAGYGLTGLRERAALSGGTLTAGPAGGEWRVSLRIPA